MNPLPVRSKRLRHRVVQTADQTLPDVTLLPFFDEGGGVRSLLLVAHDRRAVSMFDWRPDLVRVPLRGPVRLDVASRSLRPVSEFQAAQARPLWHDDPAWLLRDRCGPDDAACAVLRATNGTGRWSVPLCSLYFRRDLARLSLVSIRHAGGLEWRRWRLRFAPLPIPAVLPASRTRPESRRRTWVLDPIWQR